MLKANPKIDPKKHRKGRFLPGNKANPKGRGATIPIAKAFKEYTTATVAAMYAELMQFSTSELEQIIEHPDSPVIKVIVAQVLIRDKRNKDLSYAERVLTRIIGPIPAKSEIAGAGGMQLIPPSIVIQEVVAPPAT